jgi:hypothetical protein
MAKARRARPLGSAKDHGPAAAERITSVELADIVTSPRHVRFTPNHGRWAAHPSQHLACRFMSARPSLRQLVGPRACVSLSCRSVRSRSEAVECEPGGGIGSRLRYCRCRASRPDLLIPVKRRAPPPPIMRQKPTVPPAGAAAPSSPTAGATHHRGASPPSSW